jgi:hypothetical protein
MKGQHWALLAGFVGALAIQIGGIDHWAEVRQPSFVAGVLAQFAAFLGAMFSAKPSKREE